MARPPSEDIRFIARFLADKTFCVTIEDHVPSKSRIKLEVPEGSVLRHLLFSVYVNDVHREPGVQFALFADDTAVYTADRNGNRVIIRLQRLLDAFTT